MSTKNRKAAAGGGAKAAAPAAAEAMYSPDKARLVKLIEEASARAPLSVQPYIRQAAPLLVSAWLGFQVALPFIIQFVSIVSKYVAMLPEKIMLALLGLCVCFFGGVFPATIAAFEAWRLCGGAEAVASCKVLWAEFVKAQKENKEDDEKDEDGDGIADVNQISAQELAARKAIMVSRAVDPQKLNLAIAGIYTGWIGVVATLQIQFAKTVTLGEVIGTHLYDIAKRVEPSVTQMLPEEYAKWVPVVVRWACKAIAISLAWWVQRVISAFHSAIRGGHMFSEHLIEYVRDKDIVDIEAKLGPMGDTIITWAFVLLGLMFQFTFSFGVPFPLNLITWPLHIVEWFIVWSVSASGKPSF